MDTQKLESVNFLRLNANDKYNADMGHVDVSDQLRNYYRMDHWLRNQKWWWALFLWGLGVSLVNSYVCYKSYHQEIGTDKKNILSQYEFRRSIALAWMKPDTYWNGRDGSKQRKKTAPSGPAKHSERIMQHSAGQKRPRAPNLSDASLNSRVGKLKCRMNHGTVSHLPLPPTIADPSCACHRWARKKRIYKQILLCSVCNVNL